MSNIQSVDAPSAAELLEITLRRTYAISAAGAKYPLRTLIDNAARELTTVHPASAVRDACDEAQRLVENEMKWSAEGDLPEFGARITAIGRAWRRSLQYLGADGVSAVVS